ncbi:MFS general substrate transporter [Martensiomyces pterosporus]|nr:MFS general substrate transporter [Martensiomyces pterosporus]
MKDYNLLGQPRWPRWKSALAFFGLAITMYLVCVAETVFNQILGDVKGKLNTTIYSQWMEASFLLTCVIVQPVWVKLAEKFGRPGPLFSSILIFMLFSIMVGAAKSMLVVCIGRALQGIGGAGMMPLALVVLTDILTPGERGVYMGILGAVIILGKWTGSIIGAALLEHSSWRWVGYLNLPAGAVALAILYFTLHDIPRPVGSVSHKLREFDYLGTLFWLGGGLMILLGLSWGGNEHPWKSTLVVCLFVFGFIVILIFAAIEGKFAKWPIIPLSILLKVRTLLTLVASFCIGVCMYGMIMFVPVYYMMLEAEGPLESSRHILWCVLGGCIGCILGGVLVSIRGRVFYRELAVLGTLIMTIGFGLLYTWPKALEKEKQAGFQVLVGLGLGLCMQQILLASQAGLPADEISTVTTLIDYARTLGGMIGLVIGEVILKQKMFVAVQQAFSMFGHLQLEGKDVVSLEAMAPLLQKMPKTVVAPVYDGIVRALHLVFVSNVPFAALACILCLFIANIPLHVILPARNTEEVPETLRTLHAED